MIRERQSGHTILIIVIVIVALAILGFLGWLFWNNFVNKSSSSNSITTFADCKAAPGSKILETFPEQCVTADGKTFTASQNNSSEETTLKTYCTDAEAICFEYPEEWTIEKSGVDGPQEPGFNADLLTVTSPDKQLALRFQSGINGIGGSCDEDTQTDVTLLDPTPIASLSGYSDDTNIDVPYVLRGVGINNEGKYFTYLEISTRTATHKTGVVGSCSLAFAQFVEGRNSVLSTDYEGAGIMEFLLETKESPTYGSFNDAKDAFDSDTYKQGASILASLHYN